MTTPDPVNHPRHYNSHPSGVECITITRHMGFNLGNVVKYLWRAGLKDQAPSLQDLKKAAWYLADEIKLREVPVLIPETKPASSFVFADEEPEKVQLMKIYDGLAAVLLDQEDRGSISGSKADNHVISQNMRLLRELVERLT